jgi:hypothetical protein
MKGVKKQKKKKVVLEVTVMLKAMVAMAPFAVVLLPAAAAERAVACRHGRWRRRPATFGVGVVATDKVVEFVEGRLRSLELAVENEEEEQDVGKKDVAGNEYA